MAGVGGDVIFTRVSAQGPTCAATGTEQRHLVDELVPGGSRGVQVLGRDHLQKIARLPAWRPNAALAECLLS